MQSGKGVVPSVLPSSLFLIFLGSMDCLTTVVGATFFGTQELNPILSGLVSTDLSAFVVLKLAVTVAVGLIFIAAQKTLMCSSDHSSHSFHVASKILKAAYYSVLLFLVIVVVNNLLVLLSAVI